MWKRAKRACGSKCKQALVCRLIVIRSLFGEMKPNQKKGHNGGLMAKKSSFLLPGGSRYQGRMRSGRFYGQGILMVSDAIKYKGNFNGGKPNGYGILTTSTGTRYEGNWKESVLNGRVRCFFANGDKYEGGLKDKRPHGIGTFTWASGKRCTGRWESGLYHGKSGWTDPFISTPSQD